jgi:hypothetical protein
MTTAGNAAPVTGITERGYINGSAAIVAHREATP